MAAQRANRLARGRALIGVWKTRSSPARSHEVEADRNGWIALGSFTCAVVAFIIWGRHTNEGGWWWLFWASIAYGWRAISALEARWFHRTATRVAVEFFGRSKR